MNRIYLDNITVINPGAEWHRKKTGILIENGLIKEMGSAGALDAVVIQGDQLIVSPGWVDLRAGFCDPGFEYKEDMNSGLEAAAHGGFTAVALLPETEPALATKSSIEYVLGKAKASPVGIYPLAALATDSKNDTLTDMFDVVEAGAAGFSSGYHPVNDNGFLIRAMQYAGMTGAPLMVLPDDKSISGKGMMNEGVVSVRLGLKGMPAIAEETDINTLLNLCRYTGQAVHLSCITTATGMQSIERAVDAGLPVTADICIHNLYFEEQDLEMFNNQLKLRPPLRTADDRDYLRNAVLKHDYISVVSDHNPQDEDRKRCEFQLAAFGAIGLQTVFPQLLSTFGRDKLDSIIDILTSRPRKVLNQAAPLIKAGEAADLTIFDPAKEWTLDESTNKSKSKNSPLWGRVLMGKATWIMNKGMVKQLI